jgi:hypothetical protein
MFDDSRIYDSTMPTIADELDVIKLVSHSSAAFGTMHPVMSAPTSAIR